MTQLNLFDQQRSNDRKVRGQERVLDNEIESWKDEALLVIETVARRLKIFTNDDVREASMKLGLAEPHHCNSIGAVMSAAAKLKIIKKTGRYVKSSVVTSHGRLIAEWESCV